MELTLESLSCYLISCMEKYPHIKTVSIDFENGENTYNFLNNILEHLKKSNYILYKEIQDRLNNI